MTWKVHWVSVPRKWYVHRPQSDDMLAPFRPTCIYHHSGRASEELRQSRLKGLEFDGDMASVGAPTARAAQKLSTGLLSTGLKLEPWCRTLAPIRPA